jgi:putative Ca2+/H+ antiporter (TMEM165/GDT1 family)
MQIDAVVIGTIASVVITIVVGAVIGYNVIKKMDKKSDGE